MLASEIAKAIIDLYVDGRGSWLSDQENISKENAIHLAKEYLTYVYIYEDKLPEHYPLKEMYNRSIVVHGVRMYPDLSGSSDRAKLEKIEAIAERAMGGDPDDKAEALQAIYESYFC